ncbi:MAG TPA: 50S ribosomal protein L23 [Anaerolineaceae bacterium]|jgi:large subunit ribosomal protein L23|nr:50S ribosomal protein L23 [Longilinea sp.]HOD04014.1 50S ribosomal protein L23 [Anaerolineaceae bacterium]HOG79003.1 50S ribosomal protein L23 [Anaerolineaceae bacterium]HQF61766.1 50S ribosomal protein L23 [Anaerolineaceae bacterium]HQH86229.1 50S ribosomal protein L23 [Anaerolineaceae bacterium]
MTTIYDILRRPLVTEKTNYQHTRLHQYAFEVADNATRTMVKDAVEKIFDVTVLRVNIINVPAKQARRARSRRVAIRQAAFKKAIITLAPEDRIAIFEGVE